MKRVAGLLVAAGTGIGGVIWYKKYPHRSIGPPLVPYDYVVVGAGSAGCVVANRLSENSENTVLVLEAGGPDNHFYIDCPAGFVKLVPYQCKWNYAFSTVAQNNLHGRELYTPRGKGWGGTSIINGMVYIRGNALDYDHWASLGNHGWDYLHVLPYFKKSENKITGRDAYHGEDGPLAVTPSTRTDDILLDAFLKAGQQAGYPLTKDFNGRNQEGFCRYSHNIKDDFRCSTSRAFLYPALSRKNCDILDHVTVSKVLLEDKKAVGVQYIYNGEVKKVKANKEVILCAGSINSPQILMLSGIGDPEDLKKHGIKIEHSLSGVGKNLQDHLSVVSSYTCLQPEATLHRNSSLIGVISVMIKYFMGMKGDAAFPPCGGGAFIKTQSDLAMPNLQIFYSSYTGAHKHGQGAIDGIVPKKVIPGFNSIVYSNRPYSRGFIQLQSADPLVPPLIDPQYLSDTRDLKELVIAWKKTDAIFHQNAFIPFTGERESPPPEIKTNDQIEEWIQKTSETLYHPVGTCKMGSDAMAVVDATLQVRGIKGLRVVDASIMPTLIGGNTNAPTIMIAEKGSDMILGKNPLTPADKALHPCSI